MKKLIPALFIFSIVVIFFWQFFFKGLLPIPADTIIGLYHPFRDLYAKEYTRGIPFKNFLITDPVRQQYPWRELVVSIEKKMDLPLWNPYNFTGTPLLANFQSAPFYPINLLLFIIPFPIGWSLIIFMGPLLAGIFLFIYLDNFKLNRWASLLGAITFSLSGFFVSWLEWGTITHTALWLPLILLSIDKIVDIKNKKTFLWILVCLFSLVFSFFAGHLQTFFYLFIFSWVYFFSRWIQYRKKINILFIFLILNILFLILTAIQWIPTLQFIALSARNIDQVGINNPGWFIPWQHLIQFVAPDFFGNPTTLNYWGVWNYGEFVGYVGIMPLILALFCLFFRRDKKSLFFGTVLLVSLIFSLPTFLAKLPFILNIPFLETAQPTRLLFLTTFSLAVLAGLGFDYFIRSKNKGILFCLGLVAIALALLWIFVNSSNPTISSINLSVAKRNLLFPTILLVVFSISISGYLFFKKHKYITMIICAIVVGIVVFDLIRFGWKFETFSKKDYLFPSTKVLAFLQKNLGEFRIMSTDSRILPPNFSTVYRLQSIDGYDPLYLLRYGELIAASERRKANIEPPFGFNRIITPHNYDSKTIDLLGVKFVLSLSDIKSEKLKKVFQEEETRVYENANVLPRAFFVSEIIYAKDNREAIKRMFENSFNPIDIAIVESTDKRFQSMEKFTVGKTNIVYYSENKIILETENSGIGFLVFTDSFYPTWSVKIDSALDKIYRTNYNFRGIIIPSGKHIIEFYNNLF